MKKKKKDIEKLETHQLSTASVFLTLASQIGESVFIDEPRLQNVINGFGRKVIANHRHGMFVCGSSMCGIRSTAWFQNGTPNDFELVAQFASRNHLPLVISLISGDETPFSTFRKSGCMTWLAESVQQYAHMLIIANRFAEEMLLPVVILIPKALLNEEVDISLPKKNLIRQFVGNPDDQIATPTPAQQLIFGEKRRRIPAWINADNPTMAGTQKTALAMKWEQAAREVYFAGHALPHFEALAVAYERISGYRLNPNRIRFESDKKTDQLGDEDGQRAIPNSFDQHNIADFEKLSASDQSKLSYAYRNIPLYPRHEESPKQDLLAQQLIRHYPMVTALSGAYTSSEHETKASALISRQVRKFKDSGAPYTQVARFFTQTLRSSNNKELPVAADPYFAIPVLPPFTAGLIEDRQQNGYLPVLDPEQCTGCGICQVYCPHSAIASVLINLENLLRTSIELATKQGKQITWLMPQVKNLVNFMTTEISKATEKPKKFNQILAPAFENLVKALSLDEEKTKSAGEELHELMQATGDLDIVVSDLLYNQREKTDKGSGELFHLSVDQMACSGCGICAANCPEDALTLQSKNDETTRMMARQYAIWENLPDTPGHTIERYIEDEHHSSLAAILASRNFNMHMHGAGNTDDFSPEKTMVHIVNSVAESARQTIQNKLIEKVDKLKGQLSGNIHELLEDALPKSNFENLRKAIDEQKDAKKPIDEVISSLGSHEQLKLIETGTLKRKLALDDALSQLLNLLKSGPTGTGRSRQTLIIDSTLHWASTFPFNFFSDPVLIAPSNQIGSAIAGTISGLARHALDNARLIRRAELESKNQYEPDIHDRQIADLSWEQLTHEEKAVLPLAWVFVAEDSFDSFMLHDMESIIAIRYPVKVVVLSSARIESGLAYTHHKALSILTSGLHINVCAASLASHNNLFNKVVSAATFEGVSCLFLLAPEIQAHNAHLPKESRRDAFAVNTRAFFEFQFTPVSGEKQFADCLHLNSNPGLRTDWVSNKITFNDGQQQSELSYSLTWADWAYTVKNFENEFIPFNTAMGIAVPVAEFLEMNKEQQAGKIPVIYRVDENDQLQQFKVSQSIIDMTIAHLQAWRLMKELAGESDKIPEKTKQKIAEELKNTFNSEKQKLVDEYEQRIINLEAEHLANIKARLTENLAKLARKARKAPNSNPG